MPDLTEDIRALREALEAGPTPGPWVVDESNPNMVARDGDEYEYVLEVAPDNFADTSHDYEHEQRDAAYIAAANPARIARILDAAEAAIEDAERWRNLYRRAVNEANGLTNYVEDRPELRHAERKLSAIEAEARDLSAARKEQP